MIANRSNRLRIAAWATGLFAVVGLGGVATAYALGCFDSKANEVPQQLQARLADHAALGEKADNNQRLSFIKDLAGKARSLPADLRKPLEEQGRKIIQQHIAFVLAMSPDEQTAALDKDIDLMQMMMREFEKQRAERDAASQNDKSGSASSNPAANDSSAPGNPPATDAERAARRNRMLSSVPVNVRAQWQQYHQLIQSRANQRGISMPNWGPR